MRAIQSICLIFMMMPVSYAAPAAESGSTTGPAPMVWCSWSSYFADATEADIVKNVDWLAEHLRPYGFQNVTIDDGYPALHHFPGVNGFLSGIQRPPI